MKRVDLSKAARAGALALFFAFVPLAASAFAQTNANGSANTAVLRADPSDAREGSDWGWLNWLGLLGLLGLIPRKPEVVHVREGDARHVRR